MRTEYGDWSIRANYELQKLTNGGNIIRFMIEVVGIYPEEG